MADDRSAYDALPSVAYTPEAEPLNTFIQPQKPQDLTPNMNSLAQGLSSFDTGMQDFLDERQKKQDAIDKVQGEADAYKNLQGGYNAGVQSGAIPANKSPAYMNAYKETQGNVAGDDLSQKFDAAYQAAGGGAMDEQTFRNLRQTFLQNNISTTDPYVLQGLLPTMKHMALRSESRYQADRDAYVKNQNTVTTGAAMNQTLDNAHADGTLDPSGQGTNVDAVYSVMMDKRQGWINNGQMPGFEEKGGAVGVDRQYTDAVSSMAIQRNDPTMLGLLKKPVPGQTYTYADTPYGQAKLKEAQTSLDTMARKSVTEAREAQKLQDEKNKLDLTGRVYAAAAADPLHPVPQDLITAASKYEPDIGKKAVDAQDAFIKSRGVQDPQSEMDVQTAVMNGGGKQAVLAARDNGHITSPEAFARLMKTADDYTKSKDVVDNIMSDPTYKNYEKVITTRAGDGKINLADPLAGPGDSDDSLRIKGQMSQAMLNWATLHPGATPQEKQKAINDIGSLYTSSIQGDAAQHVITPVTPQQVQSLTGGTPGPMTPGAGKGTPGQDAAMGTTPQGLPAVPVSPARSDGVISTPSGGLLPSPAPTPAFKDPNVQGFYGTFTPAQRTVVQGMAARGGITEEQAATLAYNHAVVTGLYAPGSNGAPGAAAPTPPQTQPSPAKSDLADALKQYSESDPVSADVQRRVGQSFQDILAGKNPENTQGGYSLAALKDDPKAAHLLDFVAGPESRGNYNAYYGHGGSTKDLSKMTFQQIHDWMGSRGTPESTATGRYQFMKKTLFGDPNTGAPGLMQRMGFKPTDKFTPLAQDTMGVQLLKDRGYDAWRSGRMSGNTFANNLAQEWASLPNMQTGKSHYDGDGLNHALVTTGQVKKALNEAGALGSQLASKD